MTSDIIAHFQDNHSHTDFVQYDNIIKESIFLAHT